jgi:chromosome segregation ATPase
MSVLISILETVFLFLGIMVTLIVIVSYFEEWRHKLKREHGDKQAVLSRLERLENALSRTEQRLTKLENTSRVKSADPFDQALPFTSAKRADMDKLKQSASESERREIKKAERAFMRNMAQKRLEVEACMFCRAAMSDNESRKYTINGVGACRKCYDRWILGTPCTISGQKTQPGRCLCPKCQLRLSGD